MSEPQDATFHVPILCEVLDRLAHEIREARKVSNEQLRWFKTQEKPPNEDFSEKQLKRFEELLVSIQTLFAQSAQDQARLEAIQVKAKSLAVRLSALASYAAFVDGSTPRKSQ